MPKNPEKTNLIAEKLTRAQMTGKAASVFGKRRIQSA